MSISSTLIQACLTNVQKEFRQLEHWLNSLHPSEPSQTSPPSNPSNDRLEATLRDISSSISQLTKQYEVQQLALHHIVDRLDILEGARNIQIDDNDDPWLFDSTSTCLENTIIEPAESVYVIHKEDSQTPVMTNTPPSSPSASLTTSSVPPIELVEPVKKVEAVAVVEPVMVVEALPEVEEELQEQEEEQEKEVQEQEEEEQEEEEEAEEEEEGVELEEITYKEQSYYKDAEGFIYGIDEEGQPTDQPIGIWKEKSQSVAFYRLK
jgi:hypothetical protein